MSDASNDAGVMQVKTDDSGMYYGKLSPGAYSIRCNVEGYKSVSRAITVSRDDTVQIGLAPQEQARPNPPVWKPPTVQGTPSNNR